MAYTTQNDRTNSAVRVDRTDRRVSTETKSAFKTTEMMAFLAAVAAVIITAVVVGRDAPGQPDPFNALDAIRYISYLTIGYMVARGLAKMGSRDYYDDRNDQHNL